MRLEAIEVGKDITIQAHIEDNLFTTEAVVAKVGSEDVVLRLRNVDQFDSYMERTKVFSLCYKAGFEINYISAEISMKHSASNPVFIAVPGITEMTATQSARSHARYSYEHTLVFSYGDISLEVRSIDISARGLGVKSDRPIPVGTFGMIDIWSPITRKSRAFQSKVANCRKLGLNEYRIGILFESSEQWILDFINDLQGRILERVD